MVPGKLLGAVSGAGVALLAACATAPAAQEVARATSPDGTLDLVVTVLPTGATVSTPYEVSIVRRGSAPKPGDVVLRTDKSDRPTAAWLNADTASVSCGAARVWHFQNFASVRVADDRFVNTRVRLDCGQKGSGGSR